MLCEMLASPIHLISSENLLLENFVLCEKSRETREFVRNF